MKNLLIALAVLASIGTVQAATDMACMNQCTGRYSYQYCQNHCQYQTLNDQVQSRPMRDPYPIQPIAPRQTDYTCLADCQNRGGNYNLCQTRCSN